MLIKNFQVGQLETNCYIVTDETSLDCAVIDPGADSAVILDYLESNHLKTAAIFLTHGHFDHTLAAAAVREATGAPIYIHAKDVQQTDAYDPYKLKSLCSAENYCEGDRISVGKLVFDVLETPGHSLDPSHCAVKTRSSRATRCSGTAAAGPICPVEIWRPFCRPSGGSAP
jgi:glyoxylase-like metal-dependent hydrolase (beta-lactamase superfamily II)